MCMEDLDIQIMMYTNVDTAFDADTQMAGYLDIDVDVGSRYRFTNTHANLIETLIYVQQQGQLEM